MVTPNRPDPPAPPPRPTPPSAPGLGRRLRGANPQGLVVLAALAVIVIVVGLVGFGLWDSYVRPERQVAVRVADRTLDMDAFVKRMKLSLDDPSQRNLSASQLSELPERLAKDILNQEVLLKRAYDVLGVGVSDSDIDAAIAEEVRAPFVRNEAGEVERSPALNNAVRAKLARTGLTMAEYRRAVHGEQLYDALVNHFLATKVPTATKSAKVRQIVVPEEAKAKELKQQIEGGADMAQLARDNSLDVVTKNDGGQRGETPQGLLPAELDGPIFSLPLGQLSDPIQSSERWVILRVEERVDSRELAETERQLFASRMADDWIKEQVKTLNAKQYLDNRDRQVYALQHSDALARLQQRPSPSGLPGGITIPGSGSVPISGGGAP